HIDISVGSQFAVCSVAAGYLAKIGMPLPLLAFFVVMLGSIVGALNGTIVSGLGIPSIVVTLATMVAWRDALRWTTEGAWVQGLPNNFQWFGFGQLTGQWLIVIIALTVTASMLWILNNFATARAVYAVGSDVEAARLAGVQPSRVVFEVFTLMGALVGLAALLNTVRFTDVPSNAGIGLELKAIAAVVVGGTSITGGRGTLVGTLIGVALLGTIGTALIFLGISPFWEKAIQGAIILTALVPDAIFGRMGSNARASFILR
ncbi:MAG: ABC transporter permease, partial [Pyrinomonadaceae bacterium]|nr:ABC transporter permease [Pyrinomonadaceae bacterium]